MLVHVFDEVVGTDDSDSDSEKNSMSLIDGKKSQRLHKVELDLLV